MTLVHLFRRQEPGQEVTRLDLDIPEFHALPDVIIHENKVFQRGVPTANYYFEVFAYWSGGKPKCQK